MGHGRKVSSPFLNLHVIQVICTDIGCSRRMTTLDQLLPQYLPVYTALYQLLTREFPSATGLEAVVPEEGPRKVMGNLVRSIFRTAVEIKFQAQEVQSLTRNVTAKLQNSLMCLQWRTKQLLGVVDCSSIYKALRQEAQGDEALDREPNHPPHTPHEKRIVIIGTLNHIILTLHQLRLSDDKHVITLPTSYLHISTSTDDPEAPSFHQEEKQILSYLADLKSSAEFLKRYLKPHLDVIDPKYLLPFFLEMGAYTRGTMLTQADKLLSGWVVWREICLTIGGWESMESRVNTRGQNFISNALLGMHPAESLSRTSSTSTTQSTNTITDSTAKGKGPATASERPGCFKHKFSFTLISIPPAEELAPKGSPPKDSLNTFDLRPQLTQQASQRLLGNDNSNSPPKNSEFSLATPINGLNHLAGPPQKIWPAAALAVQSKGIVTRTQEHTLIYMPKTDGPPKTLLDENFSLEDVLRFYAAAMEEQKMMPFSVPGSSVGRAYWQMKQMDDDKKKNEELIDALLSTSTESAPISPTTKGTGTDKMAVPQRTSSTERRKRMVGEIVKKLSRFTFSKSDSTAGPATPTKNSKNSNVSPQTSPKSKDPQTTPTEISSEGANPSKDLPAYTPPSFSHLDSEQISSITTCFNLRKDFRATLRLLSEMKTEVKCLFDGEVFVRGYLNTLDLGMQMRPELHIPREFLDREYAWRKLPQDITGGAAGGTVGGTVGGIVGGTVGGTVSAAKGKQRMELE